MLSIQNVGNFKQPIELIGNLTCCGEFAPGELGTHRNFWLQLISEAGNIGKQSTFHFKYYLDWLLEKREDYRHTYLYAVLIENKFRCFRSSQVNLSYFHYPTFFLPARVISITAMICNPRRVKFEFYSPDEKIEKISNLIQWKILLHFKL